MTKLTAEEARELRVLASAYHWAGYQEGLADADGGDYEEATAHTKSAGLAFRKRTEELTEGGKPDRLTQPLDWANAFVKPEPTPEGSKP